METKEIIIDGLYGENWDTYVPEAAIRAAFWQRNQVEILTQLNREFAQGWEPLSELGPGGIELYWKKAWHPLKGNAGSYFLAFITIPLGFGIFWLFAHRGWVARPQRFRLALRRSTGAPPKSYQ